MTADPCPDSPDSVTLDILGAGTIEVVARLRGASNVTLVVHVVADGEQRRAVYKPVSGERPLWDFPDGTLAGREVAAYLVASAAGCDAVPPTVLREDAPFGPGSVQAWAESESEGPGDGLVDLFDPGAVPDDWRTVLVARDGHGEPVLLAHADTRALRDVAVLDIALNNADRKGGHLLIDDVGRVRGVDHGLTFHCENKLRTVLWGWAGEDLDEGDRALIHRLQGALERSLGARLADHVTRREVRAFADRMSGLLAAGHLPSPDGAWPAIPWPAF